MSYPTQQASHGAPGAYVQRNQSEQFEPWGEHRFYQAPENGEQHPYPPSQEYTQSPPQEYTQSPPVYNNSPTKAATGEKIDFNDAFIVEKPRWNDIWASILFALVTIGFIVASGFAFSGYKNTPVSSGKTLSLNIHTIALFAVVVFFAFFLSLMYFLMVRYLTKVVIYVTAIMQIVMGIITAAVYFIRHSYAAGVIFLLVTIVYIFCFLSWRKKIPFSVLMLQTVIDVSKEYGHVFVVSSIGGFVATIFSIYFAITLVGIYAKYHPGGESCGKDGGSCSTAKVAGLVVFVTFAAFWITEVIKNVIHVTISGVYGSWYFCSQKPGGLPKGATRGAFKRASTYSFGSISFGSLLVAIIQFMRQLCSLVQAEEQAEGDIAGMILSCFLGCFLNFLDWLVEFINEYAFSYIALYGKAYIPAAKDTWRMFRNRGVDALLNECIVNPVLTMGSIFVAYISAFIAFLYMEIVKPSYNSNGGYTPVVMAVAFLLGLQICNIFLVPIKSGLATFFVAMAFDPEVLENDFPDLYKQMVVVHPKVEECVRPSA